MKNKKVISIILITVVAIVCIVWIICNNLSGVKGATAVVKVSGETVCTLNLNENTSVYIDGKNDIKLNVVVEDGFVYTKSSECPDKICVNKGKISKTNENIVCLPAETVIEIQGEELEEFDAAV